MSGPIRFKKVLMPANPNLDKFGSYWLLSRFPARFGLDKRHVVQFFTLGTLPGGKTWKDFPDTVFLDCAGSPFDGHGKNKDVSGTRLVARMNGLQLGDQRHHNIIYAIDRQDKTHRKHGDCLGSIVVAAHRVGKQFTEIRDWVFEALDQISAYEQGLSPADFNSKNAHPWMDLRLRSIVKIFPQEKRNKWYSLGTKVLHEVKKMREFAGRELQEIPIEVVPTYQNGGFATLAVCETKNPFLGATALRCCDVVVNRLEIDSVTKITMIAVGNKSDLNLQNVAATLRFEEIKKTGNPENHRPLICEGRSHDGDCWFVQEMTDPEKKYTRIFNGTEQHPCVVPTTLTTREIVETVKKSLLVRPMRDKELQKESKD